jgi:hypothetical protein
MEVGPSLWVGDVLPAAGAEANECAGGVGSLGRAAAFVSRVVLPAWMAVSHEEEEAAGLFSCCSERFSMGSGPLTVGAGRLGADIEELVRVLLVLELFWTRLC